MVIDIVSLAWNKYEVTENFLKKLKRYTDIPYRLIFTNNGSTEPISDLVRQYYPEVVLLEKKENIGCPRTRNKQMKLVKSDICFWLDNDCIVGPNWYKPVLEKLGDPTIGISGPTGYTARYPFNIKFPFEMTVVGDCDFIMGYLVGFKTKYYKPINDYNLPVNLDDTELALGIKDQKMRCVVSDPCFAQHLTSQTERGWDADGEAKLREFWNNWKDKDVFERYK